MGNGGYGVYHGIIVSISQRDKKVFEKLKVIGKKRVLLGLITLYKVEIPEHEIDAAVTAVQKNMTCRLLFKKQEFYAHFYRGSELIIVFRERIFSVSTDRRTWPAAIGYGRNMNISEKQLDFIPNRFEDEDY